MTHRQLAISTSTDRLHWRNERRMRGHFHLFAATSLCAAIPSIAAAADQQPICAARPGKSTPACTVPAGHLQLETGLVDWSLQKVGDERDTAMSLGETTVKYGLTDRSDIEIDVIPWQRATSRGPGFHDSHSGFGDVRVAYKQQLTANDSRVQIAALPYLKIPTARRPLGNRQLEGGLLVPMVYSIPESPFSIGATPEFDWIADADGGGHHSAMIQVVSLGWQATDKFSISGEMWGQWDWDPSGSIRKYSVDGSIAYLVNNNLQLDAGANLGVNPQTPDVELYTGVSARF